jgi:hypothetical protein
MFLIQILLPLNRNDGTRQPPALFTDVRDELVARFGGLTAYARAPAVGLWNGDGNTDRDDVVTVEVMTGQVDHAWWAGFRQRLERRFEQESVVVRALPIVPL